MKIFYGNILVGEILTNQSMTVEQALGLIGFNEQEFIEANGFDDIDINDFELVY